MNKNTLLSPAAESVDIIGSIPAGIAVIDIGDTVSVRCLYGGIENMCGYCCEDYKNALMGSKAGILPQGLDAELNTRAFASAAENSPFELKYKVSCADGTEAWHLLKASFSNNVNNAKVYYCVITDITEIETSDRKLWEGSACYDAQCMNSLKMSIKLNMLLSQSDISLCEYDLQEQTVTIFTQSDSYELVPYKTLQPTFFRQSDGIIHEDDMPLIRELIRRHMAGEKSIETLARVKKDGKYRWHRLRSLAVFSSEKDVCSIICSVRDINEEYELRRQYEQEAVYLEKMGEKAELFAEYDFTDKRLLASKLLNFSGRGEALFSSVCQLVHPEDKYLFEQLKDCNITDRAKDGKRDTNVECRVMMGGAYVWMRVCMFLRVNPNCGHKIVYICGYNIDERKKRELSIIEKARKDALSSLFNRATFEELTEIAIKNHDTGMNSAMLLIDIDDFKGINDSYGHIAGDDVIRHIGRKLNSIFGVYDIVGRLGGDEFAVLMSPFHDEKVAYKKGLEVCSMIGGVQEGDDRIQVSCSVGIAFVNRHGSDFNSLYYSADVALYKAKRSGKNRCAIFSADDINMCT